MKSVAATFRVSFVCTALALAACAPNNGDLLADGRRQQIDAPSVIADAQPIADDARASAIDARLIILDAPSTSDALPTADAPSTIDARSASIDAASTTDAHRATSDARPATIDATSLPTVDAPPRPVDTKILLATRGVTSQTSLLFEFDANRAASFKCQLDSAPPFACTSPLVLQVTDNGPHQLSITASTSDGAVDATPAIAAWVLDPTPPNVSIDKAPPAQTLSATPSFGFSADEESTFQCQIEGAVDLTPCASIWTPSVTLPIGNYTFDVIATDTIGGYSEASYSWAIVGASCGDGVIEQGEQCDDGGNDDGDGCSSTCTIEPDYSCSGQPSVCVTLCGNGIVDAGEQCDDGNDIDGDGCSPSCRFDLPGWRLDPLQPPVRARASMGYDSEHDLMVSLGGDNGVYNDDFVYSWDNTNWRQNNGLGYRRNPNVAYDTSRNRLFVYGGDGLDDTWEFDGTTWTQLTPDNSPGARTGASVVYDSDRQCMVLFGGSDANGDLLVDTWEWDGAAGTWTSRDTLSSPPGRLAGAMAYDSVRKVTVLYGGNGFSPLDDMWQWDGVAGVWTQIAATTPPARAEHSMAFDSNRGRVVLFGGTGDTEFFGDTWEWDGTTWTSITPAASPSGRRLMSFAYDSKRNRVVLHGGEASGGNNGTAQADTWAWDGTNWTELGELPGPGPRWATSIVWDDAMQRVILVGGFDDALNDAIADTWAWDGTRWTQLHPATEAHVTAGNSLAYDSDRQRVVRFGDRNLYGNTWEFDGTDWHDVTPATSPTPRDATAMVYDSARHNVVLFGGQAELGNGGCCTVAGDTWTWNGTTWTQLSPAHSPSARQFHAMAYDPDRQRTVLFGGVGASGALDDTWEWDGTDWTQMSPVSLAPTMREFAMTYDTTNHRIIAMEDSNLYAWDGVTWKSIAASGGPGSIEFFGITYDPLHGQLVTYGNAAEFTESAETWTLSSSVWTP